MTSFEFEIPVYPEVLDGWENVYYIDDAQEYEQEWIEEYLSCDATSQILNVICKEFNEAELEQYIWDDEVIKPYVKTLRTKIENRKLICVVELTEDVSEDIKIKVTEYVNGQCSDGWGENGLDCEIDGNEYQIWTFKADELDCLDLYKAKSLETPSKEPDCKYPDIQVKLVGEDGNVFAIMGRVTQALRKHNIPEDEINQFREEAESGDYNQLLMTVLKWVSGE